MATTPDRSVQFRTRWRAGVSATLAASMLVLAVLAPEIGAAHAERLPAHPPYARQIVPPIASPAPPDDSTGARAPAQSDQPDAWRIADTGGVPARVRSAPSLDAAVVMRLEPGTVVEPLTETASADGYQWRRISVAGATGWIVTSLLLEPPPPPRIPVYTVAAVGERGLNVRESPSVTAPVVGSLREGQVVQVAAGPREGDGRQWLQVRTDVVTGWVVAEAIGER